MQDAEYYLNNPDEFEALTESEQDAIFNGTEIETEDAEDVVEDETVSEEEISQILGEEKEALIPYGEVKKARQAAHEAQALAEQRQALIDQQAKLIADLQAAKEVDAGTEDTEAQDEVIENLRDEFSEILGDNFEAYIAQILEAKIKPFKDKTEKAEAQLRQLEDQKAQAEQSKADAEYQARVAKLDNAYENWREDIKTEAWQAWFEKLPVAQQQYAIEVPDPENLKFLLDSFTKQSETKAEIKTETKTETKPVKTKIPPVTLSEIVGKQGDVSEAERYLSMSKQQKDAYMAKLEDKPGALEKLIADLQKLD